MNEMKYMIYNNSMKLMTSIYTQIIMTIFILIPYNNKQLNNYVFP